MPLNKATLPGVVLIPVTSFRAIPTAPFPFMLFTVTVQAVLSTLGVAVAIVPVTPSVPVKLKLLAVTPVTAALNATVKFSDVPLTICVAVSLSFLIETTVGLLGTVKVKSLLPLLAPPPT